MNTTANHEITLKDLYGEVMSLKGQVNTIALLATRVTDVEKEIILLKERSATHGDTLKAITETIKEDQKQNQRILIAIGVIAIIASAFGPFVVGKLFA